MRGKIVENRGKKQEKNKKIVEKNEKKSKKSRKILEKNPGKKTGKKFWGKFQKPKKSGVA